jgi:hypothetical protein
VFASQFNVLSQPLHSTVTLGLGQPPRLFPLSTPARPANAPPLARSCKRAHTPVPCRGVAGSIRAQRASTQVLWESEPTCRWCAQAKAEAVSTAQPGISQILVHSDGIQPQPRLPRRGTACRRVWLELSVSLHSYLLLHRDDKYNPVVLLPGTTHISVTATTHTHMHMTHAHAHAHAHAHKR